MAIAAHSINDLFSAPISPAPFNRILQAAEDTGPLIAPVVAREGNVTQLPVLLTRQDNAPQPAVVPAGVTAAREEGFSWATEGRIERLKALAAEGKKAREIAEIMGTTKNSVICKCNRLGIELKHKKPYMDNLKGIAKRMKNGKPLSEEEVAERTARLQQRIQDAGEPRERRASTPRAPRSKIPTELLTFRPTAARISRAPVASAEIDLSWVKLAYSSAELEPTSVRELVEAHGMSAEDTAFVLGATPDTVLEICTANQITPQAPVTSKPAVRARTKSAEKAAPKAVPAPKAPSKAVAEEVQLLPYPGSLNISFMDLKERHCREIMGSDGGLAVFCGQHKKDGSSFCVHHHRMNYEPLTKPKRQAAKKSAPWFSARAFAA